MKKFLAAVLAAIVALSVFAGCNLTQANDDNTVIAVVNGVNILKKKYNEMYDYYLDMYTSSYGYEYADAVEMLESYKKEFLTQLVQEELLRQRAEAEGYLNYTEEDIAAAKAIVDEDKKEYVDSVVESYVAAFEGQEVKGKNENETDKEYFIRIAEEKYYKDLKTNGYTYQEFVDEQLLATALEKYRDDNLVGVTVTEAEIIEKYDSMYNEQLEALSTDKKYVDAYTDPKHTYTDRTYICNKCGQKAAGLYDANDNMVASWDELVNTYGMSVTKNCSRARISFNISFAIMASLPSNCKASTKRRASSTESAENSAMFLPPTVTASDSGFKRSP